mgnify:FL=1
MIKSLIWNVVFNMSKFFLILFLILTFNGFVSAQRVYNAHSILATGNWYKIAVNKAGIYRMDLNFLAGLGINTANLNSASIRLFGNGGQMLPEANAITRADDLIENAIMVMDGGDGVFNQNDYILFYAAGPDEWVKDSMNQKFSHRKNLYTDSSVYFINIGSNGKRITTAPIINVSANPVSSYSERFFHELDTVNFLSSGKEWFGEELSDIPGRSLSRSFSIPNIGAVSGSSFTIVANAAARSIGQNSRFDIHLNNQLLTQLPINAVSGGQYDFFAQQGQSITTGFNSNQAFDIRFSYVPGSYNAQGWINWFEVFSRKELSFNSNVNQFLFRDWLSVLPGSNAEFIIKNANATTQVWDVTYPQNPQLIQGLLSGNDYKFINNSSRLREYVAFNSTTFLTPVSIGKIANQDLHNTSPVSMLIIIPQEFIAQAEKLAQIHQQQNGLNVKWVTIDAVYNEFGSGNPDPTAIRDFVKMYYDKYQASATYKLKYLLLFGDASFDYMGRIKGNTNLIPAYQTIQSLDALATYTSDDFFGFLDDNEDINSLLQTNLLDIGIGRVPAKNITEAKNFVDKVQSYYATQSMGPWRNNLCFIADDEDNNLHLQDAETVSGTANAIAPVFNQQKVYLDAFHQETGPGGSAYPQVNLAINNQIESGTIILNYNGHGGPQRLAEETILDQSIINGWKNKNRLPLFITATCDFAPFDNPLINSIGENILLRPQTGGIALMTTTRPVFAFSNRILNNNYLYTALKTDVDGKYKSLGDAIKEAKNFTYQNAGDIINTRKFILLGDPALTLAFPEKGIQITKVNNLPAIQADTLSAAETTLFEGEIIDRNGNVQTDFNGTVYPLVFDKPNQVNTIGNDPGSMVTTFQTQTNLLFKGKATVASGRFVFTFKVPKDINFQYGNGKLSLYAENGVIDVNGLFTDFYVGGAGNGITQDSKGPDIKLYLNDERFVNGGLVNQQPILLAKLFDTSGINITGTGIGHDIVATIDGDNRKYFILNDFFQNELNSFQNGTVWFQMPSLAPGIHTLNLKAWDVMNNSSETQIEFTVADDNELELKHVLNYPNPFTTHTNFWFEHNKPGINLDVTIEVMTITGRIIKTINQKINTPGNRSTEIFWDGKDEFGDKIARGVYLYSIKVSAQGLKKREKIEKIVIF